MAGTLIAPSSSEQDTAVGAQSGSKNGEQAMVMVPFGRASREHIEPAFDTTASTGTTSTQAGPFDVPAYGYLRGIWLIVEGTTAGNSANVTFAEDGPYNVLQDIQLADVNGNPLLGPMTGYDLYLINKYGGYDFAVDPENNVLYTATTGTGATGGSFSFILRIPVEISGRDGLGALINQNAAQTYKVRYSLAPTATVYGTVPTAAPSVRVRGHLDAWAQPRSSDPAGMPQMTMPPAHGTTQYWQRYIPTISAGQQVIRFSRVGYLLRNLIIVYRNASSVRQAAAQWPDPVRLVLDGNVIEEIPRTLFQYRTIRRYNLTAAIEAANGLDTGVWVWDFTHELDGKPGWEQRDGYIATTQASRLEISGSFGVAGSLTILTNDVAPFGQVATQG